MGEVFLCLGRWRFFAVCGCRALLMGGMRLDMIPYTCAEIPPAGAPSGFDSAAFSIVLFVLTKRCRSAQDDTESIAFCEM